MTAATEGPLAGVRVLEFAALGPVTFCAMLLADLGAEVVRVERPAGDSAEGPRSTGAERAGEGRGPALTDLLLRGRRRVELDLKSLADLEVARELATAADVLVEGSRPGVMERLGLGPDVLRRTNPGLVYGRLTGWGQTGERAPTAGHDINYIALAGALAAIGEKDGPPVPPLALVGDFGGGAMFLATGICAALYRRELTGAGEVIDAAMADGARLLMSAFFKRVQAGEWLDERGSNMLDGGCPFYTTYRCRDGKFIAVGCVEGKFFAQMLRLLDVSPEAYGDRFARAEWRRQRALLQHRFRERDRDEWDVIFQDTDACVTPVLTMPELLTGPDSTDRPAFFPAGEFRAPVSAPRLESTPDLPADPESRWVTAEEVLRGWISP